MDILASRGKSNEIQKCDIDNIQEVKLPALSRIDSDELKDKCKSVLRRSMIYNESKEVAYVYAISDKAGVYVLGGEDEDGDSIINLYSTRESYELLHNEKYKFEIVVVHNHPNSELFSIEDLVTFIGDLNIYSLALVTNRGKVHILIKKDDFSISNSCEKLKMLVILPLQELAGRMGIQKDSNGNLDIKSLEPKKRAKFYKVYDQAIIRFLRSCSQCGIYYI